MTDGNRSNGTGDKPVVRAQRRRRGTDSAVPRARAEAPRREGRQTPRTTMPTYPTGSAGNGGSGPAGGSWNTGQTGSTGSTGGTGGMIGSLLGSLLRGATSGSGTTRGTGGCSGRTLIVVVALIALFICVLVAISQCGGLMGGLEGLGLDGSGLVEPTQPSGLITAEEVVPVSPTNTARPQATRPAVVPSGPTTGEFWLVMLYQDADDKILEKDIYLDLNEAERVGSTDNVRIVTQIDRFRGGYADDGDWTGTRRYLVTRDDNLNRLGSDLIQELNEANMADGNTLVDFVTWAVGAFPSDRYALIMSDHGMGWPGGWSDPDPAVRGSGSSPLSAALGNQLYLDELDAALSAIRQQTGIQQFELIGMDACLMGQLEVYSTLAAHARYAVASEETEPALGWAYASFLDALVRDPTMDGAELGRLIVDSYVREDQRIVDDAARADLLKQG